MAYTYIGNLARGSQSDSSYNGVSWKTPVIIYVGPYNLGTRQGLDPVANGSWDRKSFRLNPVKIIKETGAESMAKISYQRPGYGIRYEGCPNARVTNVTSIQSPVVTWSNSRADFVYQKVLAKLHASEFDLGTNLGEMKETLQMLRSPLKAIRQFLQKSSRMKGETTQQYFRRMTDATSGTWLEYRYGIRPLISTVSDAIELYEKGFRQLLLDKVYRRKSRILMPGAGGSTMISGNWSSFVCQHSQAWKTEEYYIGKCYFKYTQLPTVYERLGLDLMALPGIAWELTSLSFVWDWFLGVGNWIESLRAEINRNILGICVTHKVVQTIETQILPGSLYITGQPTWRPTDTYSVNRFVYKTEFLERRVFSSTGFRLPAFNPSNLDMLQVLDSLTLIWQRLPKRR